MKNRRRTDDMGLEKKDPLCRRRSLKIVLIPPLITLDWSFNGQMLSATDLQRRRIA